LPYVVLFFKAMFFCMLAILLRGTVPRYRFDQLVQLTWKHFIFVWLAFLLMNTFYLSLFYFF
jgi:NADH:ubiquinone oxidoreductase subunit H